MNFKKGNFVSPNNGFKQGKFKDLGSINPAPSPVTSALRNFKNNPKYSFGRNLLTGASFLPIGRLISSVGKGGLKILKIKSGTNVSKTMGNKPLPKTSQQIINNRVNQNIQKIADEVPALTTTRAQVTGMPESFFQNVEKSFKKMGLKEKFPGYYGK
tara:strand:- start:213 stop:683 length:471 start_codon:yes stop_codon:yes gene_type:complete